MILPGETRSGKLGGASQHWVSLFESDIAYCRSTLTYTQPHTCVRQRRVDGETHCTGAWNRNGMHWLNSLRISTSDLQQQQAGQQRSHLNAHTHLRAKGHTCATMISTRWPGGSGSFGFSDAATLSVRASSLRGQTNRMEGYARIDLSNWNVHNTHCCCCCMSLNCIFCGWAHVAISAHTQARCARWFDVINPLIWIDCAK